MIRLGLRLALGGGREAVARLITIAAAVALGTAVLLISLAGLNAVQAQNGRYAWLETGAGPAASAPRQGTAAPGSAAPDPLWWLLDADYFRGQTIGEVYVAATGPRSPVPPGIPRLPAPGQYYASPALTALLHDQPAAQLGDRFRGRQVGVIGPSALPAPDSLLIVIGATVRQLDRAPYVGRVTSIQTATPSTCGNGCQYGVGIDANGIDLILTVVAAALLFPVLILIGTATRLAAARREQRFAAIRLAGGTPAQVAVISAVESAVAAAAGIAGGFGLFAAVRDPLAAVPFTGAPFFPADLTLSLADVLAVAIGVPAAAAVVALASLRRVQVSPLGVSRRVAPRPLRARRVLPLVAGVLELGVFLVLRRPPGTASQIAVYLPGFLLIMTGLMTAGPWLTMLGARTLARRASRPAALIAARRLADNPHAAFRAISGLILALFITSATVGAITTVVADDGGAGNTSAGNPPAAAGTVVDNFFTFSATGQPVTSLPAIGTRLMTQLSSVPEVLGVTVVHANPFGTAASRHNVFAAQGLISCRQLSRTPALGRCPEGAAVAAYLPLNPAVMPQTQMTWPAATITLARLQHLGVLSVAVATSGSASAVEQVRTVLRAAFPFASPALTVGQNYGPRARLIVEYQQLAEVVIIASLVIAGCTLAASVAGGLSERKRPFSLLRLTGVPLSLLRRVVALESAVPLVAVACLSAAMGFLAAQLFLRAQLKETLQPPSAGYFVIVTAGLALSLAVIAATLPILNRITGPETARNE
jgi:hypothetical protein